MRRQLSRRGLPLAASLTAIALCAGCGEVHARLTLGPARPVAVAVEGPPSALYAPLYAAEADGEFHDGALAVTIGRAPGDDSLRALESHAATVAIASEPELLAARDAGAQLVAIGALMNAPLDAIVSLARRPVTSAHQLAGHTIATDGSALAAATLGTALAKASVASGQVHRIDATANLAGALRSRRAIATLGGPWPLEQLELETDHHPTVVLSLPQAGVPTYSGEVIVVRVDEAHYQGALLRAFLQSLVRGARDVAARPAATAATLTKRNPAISAADERALLSAVAPLTATATGKNPFGYQSNLAWQNFGNWMHAKGLLTRPPNASLAVTDEFLPGEGEQIVTGS